MYKNMEHGKMERETCQTNPLKVTHLYIFISIASIQMNYEKIFDPK